MHAFRAFVVAISLTTTAVIAAEIGKWGPWTVPKDSPFVAAGFKHDDGGALAILCDTKAKLISLVLEEQRASRQTGGQSIL
jgi:hypothetical protein